MGIENNEMEKARLKQWEYLDTAIPKIKTGQKSIIAEFIG